MKQADNRVAPEGASGRQQGRPVRKRRRGRAFLVLLVGVALMAVTAFLMYRKLFVVKTMTVLPSEHYTAEQLTAAAGLPEGVCLYSFSSLDVSTRIRRNCPYVGQVTLTRYAPDRVEITVTEDTAVFWADVFGETWALSGELRVLERLDTVPEGLLRLKLPSVQDAVAGSVLSFRDGNAAEYISSVLRTVRQSSLFARLDWVDLRKKNDLVMVSDGLYRLEFGTMKDLDVKLRLAEAVLKDSMFQSGSRAVLDLSKTGEPSVILDNEADLS